MSDPRLAEYKRLVAKRLEELVEPHPILELWMNDDDVNWLKSINIVLDKEFRAK